MKAFVNGTVLVDGQFTEGVNVVFDRNIIALCDSVEQADVIIDLKGHYLVPGLIDSHIHGAMGSDVMDATPEALSTIGLHLASCGVTRYLASTMTAPLTSIHAAIGNVKSYNFGHTSGAIPLGIHLEGPYINRDYVGAHDVSYLRTPDWQDFIADRDVIKRITLAVELPGSEAFMQILPDKSYSLGHSAASFEAAIAAYDRGARHVTHAFNAMPSLHHRVPGIIGAIMARPFFAELIVDGVHIHPALLSAIVNMIGADRVVLISDSIRAAGLTDGRYELGGQVVTVERGTARLASGQLAGSTLSLDQAIRNMVLYSNLPLASIIMMATQNPAKSLNLAGCGAIKVGYSADFAVFDRQLNVVTTWLSGTRIFANPDYVNNGLTGI